MKFNFCPTCGEYLTITYTGTDSQRRCPLGHSMQIPKTIISAAAILTDKTKLLMEKKLIFNREFWALPHVEVATGEPPETTLSKVIQNNLSRKISVESLVFADGDEQMFHLFYELKMLNSKSDMERKTAEPYAWFAWQDMPWDKIAYQHHHGILLQWFTILKEGEASYSKMQLISQYRGIKIL